MASYSRRQVVTTRIEYVLSNPAHWTEVGKAFAAAENELAESAAGAVWVESRDDEVVVWFEKSKESR